MQDALILHGFWGSVQGYTPDRRRVLNQHEARAFYNRLCGARMENKIDFASVEFGRVDFTGAIFLQKTVFDDATFMLYTRFRAVRFFAKVHFQRARFQKTVLFERIECRGKNWLTFSNAIFAGEIRFVNYERDLSVNFYKAKFAADVYIKKMPDVFTGSADFDFTAAKFIAAITFVDISNIRSCKLKGQNLHGLFVENCTFEQGLDLQDVTIRGQADLKNFDSTLNLRGATFINHPPELFGSDLKPDSDLACVLPKVPDTNHINIYEDLRQHAERLGKLDDRKRFVHAELSCRAIDTHKSGAERIVWALYRWTSDYGTSVYRPLGWLLGLFLFSALPWVGYALWFAPLSVTTAIGYNILQAVPFPGHMSAALLASDGMTAAPSALHFVAGVLSLFNPIFWFLTGLGLRFQLRLAR